MIRITTTFHHIKGTVSRDFLPPVFSMNRPHIVPKFTPYTIFLFCFEFEEIFVFKCCSPGFDTPQDFVPRRLIPRRSLSSGVVSDPAGCCFAGYQTSQNKCLLWNVYCSAGSDTPQDWVPWVLIPRRILFCGSDTPQDIVLPGIRSPLAD
jgi:hypothetical protein